LAASPATTLLALLTEEVGAVGEFLAVLKQEESALTQAELDPLLALAGRKGEFTARLNALVERREAILKAGGLPAGREGMDKLAAADKSGQVGRLWSQLLAVAGEARAQNEINGKLIAVLFQHNQRALSELMAAANMAMTYGADGQQKGGGGGRLLGSA